MPNLYASLVHRYAGYLCVCACVLQQLFHPRADYFAPGLPPLLLHITQQ